MFARLFSRFGLPLLTKEMVEQAARKRTYVLRTVFAAAIVLVSVFYVVEVRAQTSGGAMRILGRGRDLFDGLVGVLFFGIYAIIPGIAAGAISVEKERNTLQLLLLTKLTPWTIIFEKLLSRLVPVLMLLLTAVPVMTVAYPIGGLTFGYLISGFWALLVGAFQVAALSILCSAVFRNVTSAFVATYVIGMIWMLGLPIVVELLDGRADDACFMFFAPWLCFEHGFESPLMLFAMSLPILIVSAGCLVAARIALVKFAFVSVGDWWKQNRPVNHRTVVDQAELAARLYRFETASWKDKFVDAVETVTPPKELPVPDIPDNQPIAWGETQKSPIGRWSRLKWILRILGGLTLFMAFCCLMNVMSGDFDGIGFMLFTTIFLWILTLLVVMSMSASLFAGERARQTLDTLLVTPLSTREIVFQKTRGLRRMVIVMTIPLLTCALWGIIVRPIWLARTGGSRGPLRQFELGPYAVCTIAAALIFPSFIMWVSVWTGLRIRNQARAIMTAFGVLGLWFALPLMITLPFRLFFGAWRSRPPGILLLSPPIAIPVFETCEYREFGDQIAGQLWIYAGFVLHIGLTLWFRHLCLNRSAKTLDRGENPG